MWHQHEFCISHLTRPLGHLAVRQKCSWIMQLTKLPAVMPLLSVRRKYFNLIYAAHCFYSPTSWYPNALSSSQLITCTWPKAHIINQSQCSSAPASLAITQVLPLHSRTHPVTTIFAPNQFPQNVTGLRGIRVRGKAESTTDDCSRKIYFICVSILHFIRFSLNKMLNYTHNLFLY